LISTTPGGVVFGYKNIAGETPNRAANALA
jgi:hypothetical protein